MVISCNILWCFSSLSPSVALLFIILMVLRRRRDTDGELTVARAPLLHKERPQGRYYGIPCDAEPVYAGWWTKGPQISFSAWWTDSTYIWVPTKGKRTDRRRTKILNLCLKSTFLCGTFEYIIEKWTFTLLWILVVWHCYSRSTLFSLQLFFCELVYWIMRSMLERWQWDACLDWVGTSLSLMKRTFFLQR